MCLCVCVCVHACGHADLRLQYKLPVDGLEYSQISHNDLLFFTFFEGVYGGSILQKDYIGSCDNEPCFSNIIIDTIMTILSWDV